MIRLGSRSKSTEVVADGHADMTKKLLLVNSGQIGRMKHGPLRSLSSLRFFPPFPPCYHALNSCFFAQIWVIVRMPASSGKFRTSVSSFFRWREKAEISRPGFGYNQESAVQIEPIYFLFFSVPQCLRGAKVLSLVKPLFLCNRQHHLKLRALSRTAFNPNRSSMRLRDPAPDGKSESRAARLPRARLVDAIKTVEDARQFIFRNSDAGVFYPDRRRSIHRREFHGH